MTHRVAIVLCIAGLTGACTPIEESPLAGATATRLADGPPIEGQIQQIQRRATWVPDQGWVHTAGGLRGVFADHAVFQGGQSSPGP
jgi:hypothetical protein